MRDRKLLIGSIALMVMVVLSAYFMFIRERERQRELEELASEQVDTESSVIEDQSRGERTVILYFYKAGKVKMDSELLRSEEREIHDVAETVLMARQIINELIKGSPDEVIAEEELNQEEWFPTWRTIPRETELRQLYLLEDGTAVVDFSKQGLEHLAGGITAELTFIQSITRSLRGNLPEIERVRFVVEGKQQPTLAGHISIAEAFR